MLAQRLVRTICPDCRIALRADEAILNQLGLSAARHRRQELLHRGGCDTCNHTGYNGRKGLYELLDITDPIRDLITNRLRPWS